MVTRNLKKEEEIFHDSFKNNSSIRNYYNEKMDNAISYISQEQYDLILDILEKINIFNLKVGINKKSKITNFLCYINKNLYNLKEINHKWLKLSKNPDIEPSEIFKDF
jgi:hypothetical protein